MFESFRPPTAAERFRGIGALPLAAFCAGQLFFTIAPLFGRIPRWGIRIVEALLLAGAVAGIGGTLWIVVRQREDLDVRALAWALAAIIASVLCASGFLALAFPGL